MNDAIDGAQRRVADGGDVRLSYYEAGPVEGPAVVLSHGFPELAYSWRHQILALAGAGYHVLAPDQRGYGESDRPKEIADYDIFHLTGDLAGLLDAAGVDRAVFVGHDWGGLVVWQMALLQPERVAGVIGVNTPYLPRAPIPPVQLFRAAAGENHYIVWFQTPGVADEVLAADPGAVFTGLMRRAGPPRPSDEVVPATSQSWVEAMASAATRGEPMLTDTELDVYVSTFTRTGFTGGLNWYRNFDRNWELTPELEGATIGVPCLMVTAELDPVLSPALAQGMDTWIADLETHQIDGCGHWTQQERPAELNALVLDWLRRRFPA
jgi:pimeloyl-ACP methyl ester carboxylesterase